MPIALLIDILSGLSTLTAAEPDIAALVGDALNILKSGKVTPEEEAAIRARLDSTKLEIDRAV